MALLLTPGVPARAAACAGVDPPKPVVTVTTTETPVDFHTRTSQKDLTKAALSDRGFLGLKQGDSKVSGLMKDNIVLKQSIEFGQAVDPQTGEACVWLKRIDARLNLAASVYIAHDFDDNPFWFERIYNHESQRLQVDRDLSHEYEGRIGDGLALVYNTPADYESGPVPPLSIAAAKQDMRKSVQTVLNTMFSNMLSDRSARQKEID